MILKSQFYAGILTALTALNFFPDTAEAGPGYGALYLAPNGEIWGTTGRQEANIPHAGNIFKIMPNGSWDWVAGDGSNHEGMNASLVNDGHGFLWGTSSAGGRYSETYASPPPGRNPAGTVFKVNMATNAVTTVVEFVSNNTVPDSVENGQEGGPYDGLELVHDVALNRDFLWGTTERGGTNNMGTVFKVDVITGAMTTVLSFTGPTGNNLGAFPRAGLTSDGAGFVWGTANPAPFDDSDSSGGPGLATVFKIEVATGIMTTIASFQESGLIFHGRIFNDGNGQLSLTDVTGTFYSYNLAWGFNESFNIHSSQFGARDCRSGLVSDGSGFLWGTVREAALGHGGYGAVFKNYDPIREFFTDEPFEPVQVLFNGVNGEDPQGTLMSDGGDFIWGTTNGGIGNNSTVFKVNKNTGVLTTVVDFRLGPGNTPPVVTLLGANPLTFEAAATFTDAGATAVDAQDGPRPTFINTTALHPTTVVPNVPGTYYVTWDATDTAGGTGTNTRTVTVVDTTPPTITGNFTGLSTTSPTMPNYMTTLATAADIVGVTQFSQSPAPGAPTTPGNATVTLSAEDAAGNQTQVSFNVTVGSTPPVQTILGSKGGTIPGAGVAGSGIPAGAVWNTFSVPSINEAGQAVVLAGFKVGITPYTGIFAFDAANTATMKLIARSGAAAPLPPFNPTMGTMKDPVLGPDGAIAWTATLGLGFGATTNDNLAIFLDPDGAGSLPAHLVARKGDFAAGSAVWSQFTSISIGANTIAFTGLLKQDVLIPVTSSNDSALWFFDRNNLTTTLALRESDPLLGSTVKIIAALTPATSSPGQGRGVESDGSMETTKVRVTLNDLRQTICDVAEDGSVLPLYTADGNAVDYGTGAKWLSFGLPTQNSFSASTALLGTVKPLTGTATTANNLAIFAEDDSTYSLARMVGKNDSAGVPNGVFTSFLDPVSASNRSVAFKGTMKLAGGITGLSNDGIWMTDDTHGLSLTAREGSAAAGASGAPWNAFTSLALPEGRGPLFVASLKIGGPVTTANDIGLWATDSTGILQLALREGSVIATKTVQSFVALSNVVGSPTQTRSFNSSGSILVKMTDTTLAQHLVLIEVP